MSKPIYQCSPVTNKDILKSTPSISSSFQALNCATLTNSTWAPKIVMPIATPSIILETLSNPQASSDETDIVQFITPPNLQLKTLYQTFRNYPNNCTFCFEGYGVNDKKRLSDDIISAASNDGSDLTIEVNESFQAYVNKYVYYLFLSVHKYHP